jgi:DNA mismatch repair protein MutL
MSRIKVLPDIVANKIAAGEVVERPASVVKELVENAVDAGADRITVEIENGGRRRIRVADTGIGMGREDALLSIERHATSKIIDAHDIDRITTLGFRGEALPSIVSVSRAVIETRRKEDDFGTRLVIDGGVLKDVTDVGRDVGTMVEISGLFYNVPARRKFLRAEDTEIRYIKRIMQDIAVSAPALHLSLVSGDRELFRHHATVDRVEMLRQVFGPSLTKLMLPLEETDADGVTVTGFIGGLDAARKTSSHQYLVINGRPIVSRGVSRAVQQGYGHGLAQGLFPAFVLYLEAEPDRFDVNVHPTKREIRIHREYPVTQAIRLAVHATVQTLAAAPDLGGVHQGDDHFDTGSRPITVYSPPPDRWHHDVPRATPPPPQPDDGPPQESLALPRDTGLSDAMPASPATPSAARSDTMPEFYEGPAFWQLKDMYIVTAVKEGALIIDQHVAHERILFEEILDHLQGRETSSQQLLFPLVLDFSAADWEVLEPMLPLLERVGFGVREFGERTVFVDAVPSWYHGAEDDSIFQEYIDEMRLHGRISSGYMEKVAAAVACRSAVKAGTPLSQEEMRSLVDRLFATREPFACPHGRPVVVKLTMDELGRRFGRS